LFPTIFPTLKMTIQVNPGKKYLKNAVSCVGNSVGSIDSKI
jgi:hypothetical protein